MSVSCTKPFVLSLCYLCRLLIGYAYYTVFIFMLSIGYRIAGAGYAQAVDMGPWDKLSTGYVYVIYVEWMYRAQVTYRPCGFSLCPCPCPCLCPCLCLCPQAMSMCRGQVMHGLFTGYVHGAGIHRSAV